MADQNLCPQPDLPERAASAKRTSTCRTCAQRGIFQVAHRVLRDSSGPFGICNWHFRGDKHPEELKAKPKAKVGGDGVARTAGDQSAGPGSTPASPLQVPKKAKEAAMEVKTCGEPGCGKKLQERNNSGYCAKHFYRSKQKAGASPKERGRPRGAVVHAEPGARRVSLHGPNGAVAMVALPETQLDAWWASLSVGRKGEILAAHFAQV